MAPKREMHPRNIFRTPPDYTALAIKHPRFRKICKLELSGKVQVDYRNEDALRALTQMLLQEYFQLENVEFAPSSLVPTLPLRLNYVLWLEDLLERVKPQPHADAVCGIDIGCGSSCIYSLLGAKKNGWHMYALESNDTNLKYARENVQRNGLEHLVHTFHQSDKQQIFSGFFASTASDREAYDFCLCNPPFYDSSLPDPFHGNTRNTNTRTPPSNCRTGRIEELACLGGEAFFVERIIDESVVYKQRVSIFTSMLGHKSSLAKVLAALQSHGIGNYSSTEFCQGKTTRWAIAWSFMDHVNIDSCR